MTLGNISTPSQSIEIVDPEGSCKNANCKPVNSFEQIQQTYNSLPSEWVIKPGQFGHIENHLNYGNINSSKQFSINFMGGYGRNPNRVSVRIKNCVTKEVTFLQTTLDFKNDCNPILNMDDWVAIHLLELMEGSQ